MKEFKLNNFDFARSDAVTFVASDTFGSQYSIWYLFWIFDIFKIRRRCLKKQFNARLHRFAREGILRGNLQQTAEMIYCLNWKKKRRGQDIQKREGKRRRTIWGAFPNAY